MGFIHGRLLDLCNTKTTFGTCAGDLADGMEVICASVSKGKSVFTIGDLLSQRMVGLGVRRWQLD
jgi:hypothetical protein